MSAASNIDAKTVRDVFNYDPETGVFTWRNSTNKRMKPGQIAGCLNSIGYVFLCIEGQRYLAHRLAWLYMTGEHPKNCIDHINGNRSDNKFSNLRQANKSENGYNRPCTTGSKSGLKGVTAVRDKWQSRITVGGKKINIGTFSTAQEAHKAYCEAASLMHGEFANTRGQS